MTEAEWLECTDPQKMLEYLRGRASDRKLRLFAVASARRYLHLIRDHRVADALDTAERFADGLAGDVERSSARRSAQQAAQVRGIVARPEAPKWERRAASLAYYAVARRAEESAWNVPDLAVEVLVWRAGGYNVCDWQAIKTEEGVNCAGLLRDIFGNPFRPLTIDPAWVAWQGGTVPKLAASIYDARRLPSGELDPARLAILADALEEAGCADGSFLSHFRGPGPHARGCWVVDLLTGKE